LLIVEQSISEGRLGPDYEGCEAENTPEMRAGPAYEQREEGYEVETTSGRKCERAAESLPSSPVSPVNPEAGVYRRFRPLTSWW